MSDRILQKIRQKTTVQHGGVLSCTEVEQTEAKAIEKSLDIVDAVLLGHTAELIKLSAVDLFQLYFKAIEPIVSVNLDYKYLARLNAFMSRIHRLAKLQGNL